MIVIVGLGVLLFGVIVGFIGVLNNAGAAHPLSENFSVLGYHVTGSTGTLFLFGIVIGALAMLGMSVLLAGAHRTAGRGRDARRELRRSRREATFLNRDHELERESVSAGSPVNSESAMTRPRGRGVPSSVAGRIRTTNDSTARWRRRPNPQRSTNRKDQLNP
jgi:hypothetical protein